MDLKVPKQEVSEDWIWHFNAIKIAEKLDPYDLYSCHKLFYDRLSDLQLMLVNYGYDVSLVGGRLLNAYRDMGVCIPPARLFTVFMVQYEGIWNGKWLNNFWELILTFIDRDRFLYHKPRDSSIPPYIAGGRYLWIAKIIPGKPSDDGFKFSIGVRGFDHFPTYIIDMFRYKTPSDAVVHKYPNLSNVVMNAGSLNSFLVNDDQSLTNPHHFCKKEWLKKRSRVFLYGSPFWTMDENYIESYFDIRFGKDWATPITDESEWRVKELEEHPRKNKFK